MGTEDDIDKKALVSPHDAALAIPQPGPTLLPAPFARAISLATRSTGLAIRVGSFFGSYGLDVARITTLSSLELARGMVEGILVRAGRDNTLQPRSDLAAADAEGILEKSLESLHHVVSGIVFWTSASFQLTGTTLFAASEVSQLLLSSLDQLFGSTDSSRAIASIVTLIRREFNNPATGSAGEKVGVTDLILALSALAYLQGRCRKALEEERRSKMQEEVIWDVVVVDDGQRVDVQDENAQAQLINPVPGSPGGRSDDGSIRSLPLGSGPSDAYQDDEQVLARLKSQISSSLSPDSSVSISSSVSTTQTITVDVHGSQAMSLPTPAGAEIIETRTNTLNQSGDPNSSPSYRVVYKIHRQKFRNTSFQRHDDPRSPEPMEQSKDLAIEPHTDSEDDNSAPLSPALLKSPAVEDVALAPANTRIPTTDPARPTKASAQKLSPTPGAIPKRTSSAQLGTTNSTSSVENTANQKKQRTPLKKPVSRGNLTKSKEPLSEKNINTKRKPEGAKAEKRPGLKDVLKGSSQSISNIWSKEPTSPDTPEPQARPRPQWKAVGGTVKSSPMKSKTPTPLPRNPKVPEQRPASRNYMHLDPESIPRSSSRASYVSVHERRRDSIVSQTDAYSVRSSGEMRPASPSMMRTQHAAQESLSRQSNDPPASPYRGHHRRTGSYVPSLYSMANDSQSSLILSSYYQKSAYNTSDAMNTLRSAGAVEGTFPSAHLLQNISRYMRFSSASYGSHFLRVMGISNNMPSISASDETHNDVRHFLHHTDSGEGNILLASFMDPGGGSDSTGSTESGMPLVHYISLDHEAKAVVLACRGTLGFEDILADLTCDYDRLSWRGRSHRVHKGVHASARRILYGGDGRVLVTLQEALKEFPEYGLVLCGHSLGGAVTALLGVMLSEPNPNGTGFVTASSAQSKPTSDNTTTASSPGNYGIPSGRPIHVFAYGPPGAMSSTLSKMTKGLITTVVHGSDIVPSLSLGLLRDFQAVALAFKKDENQAKAELRQRMWQAFQSTVTDRFYTQSSISLTQSDDRWMMPALQSLSESMKNEKLMPPGEVFCIETKRVLRRDAFVLADEHHIGRPAQRIVLRYVKDVQARFGEVRFGTTMLIDHSPANYESALNKLRLGVAD